MEKFLDKLFIKYFGNVAAYATALGLTLTSIGFVIWSIKWVCSLLGLFGL